MSYGAIGGGDADAAALLDKAGEQRRMSTASANSKTGRFRDPEIEQRGVLATWAYVSCACHAAKRALMAQHCRGICRGPC